MSQAVEARTVEDLLDSLQSLTPGNRRERESATVPAQAIAFHGKVRSRFIAV